MTITIGLRLKVFRQTQKLSQEQLAEKLNVSRQAITKWENDKGIPDVDNIIAISKLLEISIDELLMKEEIMETAHETRVKSSKLSLITSIIMVVSGILTEVNAIIQMIDHNCFTAITYLMSGISLLVLGSLYIRQYILNKCN